MDSLPFLSIAPFVPLHPSASPSRSQTLNLTTHYHPSPSGHRRAALRNPRGFGPTPRKTKKQPKTRTNKDDDDEEEDEDEPDDDVAIPEVVTNRMIGRMGLSVGLPVVTGLLFFPFFYYLKVVAKIDVPNWVPFIVSFIFFGTALLGVSYGIVSASWDPLREGSLLGWNEARRNWPVFWESLWGGKGRK